ncbi:hypothetical protein [Microvirga brassicacearum]|uniref:Uncharacterized protein n=1 Tax=Microvirga brassicacearum TaxID=2580413 RepID=A0A5N3PH29_9HYPH|nr:hypothetical protein [Microvirga brassicacearum]KAB0269041.1 hypothetical protein FEZ63_02735 [Microvirga brassicacearum]
MKGQTMASHTPGPYSYTPTGGMIYAKGMKPVGYVATAHGEAVKDANGKLFAAAPLMLDILKQATEAWEEQFDGPADQDLDVSGSDLVDWFTEWRGLAKAAIAAVEGKANG